MLTASAAAVNAVLGVPPNVTWLVEASPEPRMVTRVPPAVLPDTGDTSARIGAAT
jgi:hypothetical protein